MILSIKKILAPWQVFGKNITPWSVHRSDSPYRQPKDLAGNPGSAYFQDLPCFIDLLAYI
jgi:hypothetical protein